MYNSVTHFINIAVPPWTLFFFFFPTFFPFFFFSPPFHSQPSPIQAPEVGQVCEVGFGGFCLWAGAGAEAGGTPWGAQRWSCSGSTSVPTQRDGADGSCRAWQALGGIVSGQWLRFILELYESPTACVASGWGWGRRYPGPCAVPVSPALGMSQSAGKWGCRQSLPCHGAVCWGTSQPRRGG